ncbi:hypothetical protein ABNQ39_12535 [Azospirillum sp. A26]|uniref:hypothetical protein n=1 Tax=Azospirillum sp. A26 TaxID=3160607 RepID=UPI003672E295
MPDGLVGAAEANRDDISADVDRRIQHRRMMELLAQGLPLDFQGNIDRDDVHSR